MDTRVMKLRLMAISLTSVLTLTGCGSGGGNFPLSIDLMPSDSARWGTYCESILGQGWSCIVDLRVLNNTDQAWNGTLSSTLVSDSGDESLGTDSTSDSQLTGTFQNVVNPGGKWEWAAYFQVADGQKFTSLRVKQDGSTVQEIPVCIGSSTELAQGC
jgi:hypothetical protein